MKAKRITLFILFCTFELNLFVMSRLRPSFEVTPFTWVLLAFAASLAGPAIAYMDIGDWIRFMFVKTVDHPSGYGKYTDKKHDGGSMDAIGSLLSCPICSATWAGAVLVDLLALDPIWGMYTVVALSIGGAALQLIYLGQMFEWIKCLAWETSAKVSRKEPEVCAPNQE